VIPRAGLSHTRVERRIGKRIRAGLRRKVSRNRGENVLRVNIRCLDVEVLLKAEARLDGMRTGDLRQVVVEIRHLFLKAVAHRNAAAEIRDAADINLRASPGQRVSDVLLIAIRPAEAEFVQNSRCER
jgi:hypothetical protein